jgi:ribosome-binding factor A
LNRCKGQLRRHLNKQLSLKFSPELRFVPDMTFDQMDETRRLLAQNQVQRDLEHGEGTDD